MNKKLKNLYYDSRAGFQVIGCLLKKPTLLQNNDYSLSSEDFYVDFHRYIYGAIHNLFVEGVEKITPVEIEGYLHQTSPKHYKTVFDDNDGIEWLLDVEEHSVLANFEYNYNRLKKMSYLRDLLSEGIDVSEVLDLQEVDSGKIESQTDVFNKTTLSELMHFFNRKVLKVNDRYNALQDSEYLRAGSKAEETKRRLMEGETYGLLGFSGYKNRISYGSKRGKFNLTSAGSGVGKTRTSLGEVGSCIAMELWDDSKKRFVINPNNPYGELSGIYVGTEMELDMEVDIILWGIVSGLETSQIIEQNLSEEEKNRLDYAIEVIKKSKIHLYNLPNYDITTLSNLVSKHKGSGEDVYILGIDYILLTGNIVVEAREYSKGAYTREDQFFLYMSKSFKEDLARKHNIYVTSSTQLNRNKSVVDSERDESMIRGSFSLTDKVDVGSILLEPTKHELEKVAEIIRQVSKWNSLKPNQVEHIFKNRGGIFKKIRIFRNVNLGNMKTVDLFVTDWDFKLIDLEQVVPDYNYAEECIKEKPTVPIF